MMVIDNKFNIGDDVYLKTDTDQVIRIVTALYVRQGSITYGLSYLGEESVHYDFEITIEKDVLKSSTN